MVKLWLVRHGESTANAGERCEGPGSSVLTKLGIEQANRTALKLASEVKADRVITSSYIRAQQTSQPFLEATGLQAENWPIQEWSFLSPKKYSGTTQEERRPHVLKYVATADPHHSDEDGVESFRGFIHRVDFFMEAVRAVGGNIVAFSHGRFIQGVRWRLMNRNELPWRSEEFTNFWEYSETNPVQNCEITELEYVGSWRRVS